MIKLLGAFVWGAILLFVAAGSSAQTGNPSRPASWGITPRKEAINMKVALPVMVFTKDNVNQFKF